MQQQDDSESLSELKHRIAQADQKYKAAQNKTKSNAPPSQLPLGVMAVVGRIATEMVAGLAVGGFLGWMLDRCLGTTPLFMILLFFLGAAAGMLNIWRIATGQGLKIGYFDPPNTKKNDTNNNKNNHENDEHRTDT